MDRGKIQDNIFTVLRITIAAACVILFILQSYQEVEKFFKGMTSMAIRTEVQNDIPYPSLVVCPKDPFKHGSFPMTTDEYLNLTYSSEEIIENIDPLPLIYEPINVTEIATFGEGRCVLLEVPDNLVHSDWTLHVVMHIPSWVYIVEKGQELCIIYLVCSSPPVVVNLEDNLCSLIKIKPVKKMRSNG